MAISVDIVGNCSTHWKNTEALGEEIFHYYSRHTEKLFCQKPYKKKSVSVYSYAYEFVDMFMFFIIK